MDFIIAEQIDGSGDVGDIPLHGPDVRVAEVRRSHDGARAFAAFQIDKRESGERALKELSDRFGRAWFATRHEPDPALFARQDGLVVVERSFAEPVRFDEFQEKESLGAWCLDLHGVEFLRTYLSEDRRRMICIYGAPDAEAVRIAQRTIDLPIDLVWAVSMPSPTEPLAAATERLILFDTTLRDGLTGRNIAEDRLLDLCSLLDETGLDVVEVGLVGPSGAEAGPIAEACARVRSAVACCLAYPTSQSIAAAAEILTAAARPRLHVFNQVSDGRSKQTGRTDLGADRLDEISETVSSARRRCADVQWSAFDGTRADPEFLCRAFAAAIAAGAGTVSLPDTSGHALPDEMAGLVRLLRDKVDGIGDVVLSAHCHDDLGLATANCLAAIGAGARQVEGTVGGIGPQGGNTRLQTVIGAVTARANRFPLRCGIDSSRLARIEAELSTIG